MEQLVNVEITDFIGIFDNAFSKDFCQRVINFFENANEAGLCYTRQQENNVTRSIKDDRAVMMTEELSYTLNATKSLSKEFVDIFWSHFAEYAKEKYYSISENCDLRIDELKIQKTNVGQGYHAWHFEQGNKFTSDRICAFQIYLNDVEDGGETEFLYYSKRIKPVQGRLIIWPGSYTHTHRGNPPLTNTKYVITSWVVFNR
jgi:hypothetical protein